MADLNRRGFLAGLGSLGLLSTLGIRLPDVIVADSVAAPVPPVPGWFDLNSPETVQMWERSLHQAITARSPFFDPAFGLVGNGGEGSLVEVTNAK